jgi:hypothetical protein
MKVLDFKTFPENNALYEKKFPEEFVNAHIKANELELIV